VSAPAKITYLSASGDLEEFRHHFTAAIAGVKEQAGRLHPFYIDGQPVETRSEPLVDRSPVYTSLVLGRFAAAATIHVDAAVEAARRLTGGIFDRGHYVAPTIAKLPLGSSLFREELFVPFLAVGEVAGLDQAIVETNRVEYGLTAGTFSGDPAEIARLFDEADAGVCYANKRTGATTGAWPGAQPFCGWKGSGSTGKGGCGPYYVAQFMREQSRPVIEGREGIL
jgi:1-pyrroline-5-carboxylate dehydrogenase